MTRWSPFRKFSAVVGLLLVGPMAAVASAAVTVPVDYPTIQSAINAVVAGAVPDGTINIKPGTYAEILNISNTAKSLTLKALGSGGVVVDAAGKANAALTIVNASGQVVITGITFRHGDRFVGGGFVIQQSSPTLNDCVFELNTASYGGGGALITSNATFNACTIRNNTVTGTAGGVIIEAGSRPVFTGCYIVGNIAGTTAADNGVGGGVQSLDSSPTFRGSHINNNSSKFAAGGIYHAGSFGSPYGTAVLVIEDSEIADNVSAPFSAAYNPSDGGGMHIEDNVTATLTRVRVLRNKANTGGGLSAYRARYDIVDSLIDANQAVARTDGGTGGGTGGGINASSTNVTLPQRPASVVNLTRSLVRNNTSLVGGGIVVTGDVAPFSATLTLTGSVIDSNTTQSQGGGVLLSNANMTATNSMIIRNVVYGSGTAFGGGILVGMSSSAALTSSTVAHNTGTLGGGFFLNQTAALTLSASNVYDNAAVGTNTRGSGIFVGSSGSQTGTIQNSIVADNTDTLYHSEIHEEGCSAITYQNNTLTPAPQFSGCAVGSRASGNNTNVPHFAHFLAVPGAGTSSTLVWSVARATSVTIAGLPASNQATGSVDVTPSSTSTYSLTASTPTGAVGPLTASVTVVLPPLGLSHPVYGDFDGDGRAELALFRPSTGQWFTSNSSTPVTYGAAGDIPVSADYDGDGKTDLAVFRPSNGTWYIWLSKTNTGVAVPYGAGNDIPVPADYDGDGKTDFAVFRPSNGTWYLWLSATNTPSNLPYGNGADIPVPADYDGDGKADFAVFRPSNGTWYLWLSATNTPSNLPYGNGADIPVPADYDGDGRTDFAIYRPSTGEWFIWQSSTSTGRASTFGNASDIPVPADYDGDGKTDIAIYRPSNGTWYIWQSRTNTGVAIAYGNATDIPVLK